MNFREHQVVKHKKKLVVIIHVYRSGSACVVEDSGNNTYNVDSSELEKFKMDYKRMGLVR